MMIVATQIAHSSVQDGIHFCAWTSIPGDAFLQINASKETKLI